MNQSNYTYGSTTKNAFETFSFFKSTWKTRKTKKPEYIFYRIKSTSENLLVEEFNIKTFKKSLSKKMDFAEIIKFSKFKFSETKEFIFQRLNYLNTMLDPDDEKMSLESLKGLLVFLYSIEHFKKPTITLNDLGYLQLNWRKDKNNLLTLNFKENYFLNYVIFMPSHYTSKRIILNGSIDILDFKNYLSKLDIKTHKESK